MQNTVCNNSSSSNNDDDDDDDAAAERKMTKYGQLAQSYTFIPVAVETLGPINKVGLEFLSDLGGRISQVSNDHRESAIPIPAFN